MTLPANRQINCNTSGQATSYIVLVPDEGGSFTAALSNGRAVFYLPGTLTTGWGANIVDGNGRNLARLVIPPPGFVGEATETDVNMQPAVLEFVPTFERLSVADAAGMKYFATSAGPFKVKGISALRLLHMLWNGEDVRSVLRQYKSAGANWVRTLAMKANNTGWELNPNNVDAGLLRTLYQLAGEEGFRVQTTVLADTRVLMPHADQQAAYWQFHCDIASEFNNAAVDLLNEEHHSTQFIPDIEAFQRPSNVLASHGSGLTDSPSVKPYWDFAPYHVRRSPMDARCFTNFDAFEFEAEWPQSCVRLPEESVKPEDYHYDANFAYQMGKHAGLNAGGTFHWSGGVEGRELRPEEYSCAQGFYRGVDGR